MSNSTTGRLTPEYLSRIRLSAIPFFALYPKRNYFSQFAAVERDGSFTFIVMARDGRVGPFGYKSTSPEAVPADFMRIFNETPQGQEFLARTAEEVFRRIKAGTDDMYRASFPNMPIGPTEP